MKNYKIILISLILFFIFAFLFSFQKNDFVLSNQNGIVNGKHDNIGNYFNDNKNIDENWDDKLQVDYNQLDYRELFQINELSEQIENLIESIELDEKYGETQDLEDLNLNNSLNIDNGSNLENQYIDFISIIQGN